MTASNTLRSTRFREAREQEWAELDTIVERALSRGLSSLTDEQLERMPMLYRALVSSLEVARKTTMDRALVAYLEALAARAYLAIYASRRAERGVLARFFGLTFPKRVRSMSKELGLSTLIFFLGIAVSFILVMTDSSWYFAFVGADLAGDRVPGATTQTLRDALYERSTDNLDLFASFLFTHNAGIGLMAFALGFAAGVPTALLVFTNGLMLGAFLALYTQHGLLLPLLGWLLPHGIPEMLAIVLCGAAGFHVARAMLWPGERTTRDALVGAGRRSSTVVTGCVLLFAIAGLIEGIFRQTVVDDLARALLATFDVLWLGVWMGLSGLGQKDDLDEL